MATKQTPSSIIKTIKSITQGSKSPESSSVSRDFRGNLPSMQRGFDFAESWSSCIGHEEGNPFTSDNENTLRKYFDENKEGPGIWKWLHYFDIYQRHLQKFVGREVHIVEVGIYSGGSLPMWHQYFGPGCHVYGVDIEIACKSYGTENTKVFIGDQADRNFWKEFKSLVPVVDILIDDGGHYAKQQIITLEEMLPHLSLGGVFLCEDVHRVHNAFSAFVFGLTDSLNAMYEVNIDPLHVKSSSFQRAIHSIHSYPYVTVIEKNERPQEQLTAPKHGTEWQPFL